MANFNFFQIDSVGVADTENVISYTSISGVAPTVNQTSPIRRTLDSKLSNFGAMNIGDRMSTDYTRTSLDFQSKDELADRATITADEGIGANVGARGTNVDHNPYLAGSTVKRTRDSQAFRMGMTGYTGPLDTTISGVLYASTGNAYSIDEPGFDVMDTNLVLSGMVSGTNWPSEGWRSFGGKYDFMPYVGGDIH